MNVDPKETAGYAASPADPLTPAAVATLDGVGLRYGEGPEALADVTFALSPGSFHFVTGGSGAGKTSLLGLLSLSRRATRGRVTVFGVDVAGMSRAMLPAIRRRIGVVFQDFRLLDHLTALENVSLPLRIAGARDDQIREHVPELLSWVGLGDHLDDYPPTLSGGQKQRVAIARAVIARPRMLLADEPTGSVDDDIAVRLMRLFEELNKLGTTVVIATHNRALVDRFPYPEIRLDQGRIVQTPVS